MAYYLQLNGTSDKIQVPSLTFDKVVFDVVSRKAAGKTQYLIDARTGTTGYVYSDTSLNEQFAAFRLYVNDVQYSSGTNAIPAGTRAIVRLENPTVGTDDVTLFARYTGIQFLQADVYDVKFYNGATLVAWYDMSTQTVNDQSGNGKHATLTGGTWVSDGPTGTDVSYTYALQQKIYADRTVQAPMNQAVYADRQNQFLTKQAFYAERSAEFSTKQAMFKDVAFSYATKQAIYQEVSAQFAMQQNIYSDYILFSASFPLKQIIYADQSVAFPTKQAIYDYKTYVFATTQRFYDPSYEIVGRVRLSASRELYVYLVASRDLRVRLQGGLVMTENQNFVMKSGNSRLIEVPVSDVDLTGATAVKWVLHQNGITKVSKDLTSGITITATGATTSEVEIKLDPADTSTLVGDFSHEMEITDSLGHVSTVMTGRISILKDYVN